MGENTAFLLSDAEQTKSAGFLLGKHIRAEGVHSDSAFVIFLTGILGAGKTTFCGGVLSAFGYSGAVKSPTYTLVEPYDLGDTTLYHFDLYRLGDPEELDYIGIREYFLPGGLALVEWPDRGQGFLPEADLVVSLSPIKTGRTLCFQAQSAAGRHVKNACQCDFEALLTRDC